MSLRWYVIRTKAQSERLAASSLERDGLELFFPLVQTPLPGAAPTLVPLFPGYLFVHYDMEEGNAQMARRLPGILGWVRFNGVAPPVPDDEVANLADRVESINSGGGLWTRFRPGDKVRVVTGKLEGLAEIVEEAKSPESRVKVLMEFMGRQVPAEIPWHSLSASQEHSGRNTHRRRPRRTRGGGRWVRGFRPEPAAIA